MIHNPIDIADKVQKAGWSGRNKRIIAVAVCWAESRFDDQALNENKNADGEVTSEDRGLFQINSKYQPQVSEECAFDPDCNVKAAFDIYKKNGLTFKPWSAYNNGAYKAYLPEATIAVEADIRINRLERQLEELTSANILLNEQLESAKNRATVAEELVAQLTSQLEQVAMVLNAKDQELKAIKENLDTWLDSIKNQIIAN